MALDTTTGTHEKAIDKLNSFLRGEISACETYRQAVQKLKDVPFRVQLEECLRSHERRVSELRSRIAMYGGKPSEGSGAWGAFAKLVEGGAKMFGTKSAIAALEEGEDHGRNDYQRELENLDLDTRTFIQTQILPEQLRTHEIVSSLKHSLH